jgi:hypothetical protein
VFTGTTLAELGFLGGAVAFVAAAGRWLEIRSWVLATGGAAVGCAAVLAVLRWNAPGWAPAASIVVALILGLAGGSLRGWRVAMAGALPLYAAAHVQMWDFTVLGSAGGLWLNELVLLAAAGAAIVALSRGPGTGHERARRIGSGLVAVAAAITLGVVCFRAMSKAGAVVTTAALAMAAGGLWRATKIAVARDASLALLGLTWVTIGGLAYTSLLQNWNGLLVAALGFTALTILLPLALEGDLAPGPRRALRWILTGAGLGEAFLLFLVQRGELASHATVACGVAAVAAFLVGLAARSRPHRLCGLAGLALCVPRAFIHDLDSTLHRIAAFVVLGVVLLWVGFSYHRFRHLIDDDEKKL